MSNNENLSFTSAKAVVSLFAAFPLGKTERLSSGELKTRVKPLNPQCGT